jgi:polyphosphate kinase
MKAPEKAKGKRAARRRLPSGEHLLNRELSSLALVDRILELAADPVQPLLERVRFCSIASTILDELFMIRVAGLLDQAESDILVRSADGRLPRETLAEIRERVLTIGRAQSKLWAHDLRPALAEAGIVVGSIADLSKKHLNALERRFSREIFPVLTPLGVGPGQPFPYISALSLSLGLVVRHPETEEERFARLKVPEALPRFLPVTRSGPFLPLEEIIAHFLDRLFPGMEIDEHRVFRVTRDADLELSDEADDLLQELQSELRRRPFGAVVRLEVAESMSPAMRQQLVERLGIDDDQVYPVRGPLDLSELAQLVNLPRPDLKYEPWRGVTRRPFSAASPRALFGSLRRADTLVHVPYDSFSASVETFVEQASRDPQVIGLKATVYRTSDDSALVPALIASAAAGQQSVCLVELKARFEEHRNIRWSQRLEQAGVLVVYGFPHLKIHAKTTLVVRRDPDGLRRYAHIGTGNYHAVNAQIYEDLGLFTADEEITADVADLFNYLTGFSEPQAFRKLLVAPFNLREGLVREIRQVAAAAREGDHDAAILIKVNALHDVRLIDELYAASEAGVRIDIVVRNICGLRPGVKGLSETIHVRSVLGRFLEHSRFFVFRRREGDRYFLGSADLLSRNLDGRIEVVTPVESRASQIELDHVAKALLSADSQAWELRPDGSWHRLAPSDGKEPRTAQGVLMKRARGRRRAPSAA